MAKTYDPNEVSLIVGAIPISGYADGSFIECSKESPDFNDVVGADGEVARSKSNDPRWTLTITLLQTSQSNAVLSALRASDLLAGNGAGVVPVLIKDNQGTTLMAFANAWIMNPPDVTFDREATERAWELRCIEAAPVVIGGN